MKFYFTAIKNQISLTLFIMNATQVFDQYYALLYSIALGFLKSKEDAEDIVQEAFTNWLLTDKSKIQNNKAYLVQTVKNACLNYIEELKRKRNLLFDEWREQMTEYQQHFELVYSDLEREMSFKLEEMMRKLNPKEQLVFVLRNSFEMSYEDITSVLDTKIENARKTFQRAKERMIDNKSRFDFNQDSFKSTLPKFIKAHTKGEVHDYIESISEQLSFLKK